MIESSASSLVGAGPREQNLRARSRRWQPKSHQYSGSVVRRAHATTAGQVRNPRGREWEVDHVLARTKSTSHRATRDRGPRGTRVSTGARKSGHRIPGFLSRAKLPRAPMISTAERLRAPQERNLAEMAQAYAERVAFFRQSLEPANGTRRRDPRSARIKRLFKRAWARPV
jgi:hypothetical protein